MERYKVQNKNSTFSGKRIELDSIGNPIFKPIKTVPKHVMVIFVPLTLGTLNFRHLT